MNVLSWRQSHDSRDFKENKHLFVYDKPAYVILSVQTKLFFHKYIIERRKLFVLMNSCFKKGILICRNIFHRYLSFLEHLVRLERGCLINYWIGKFEVLLLKSLSLINNHFGKKSGYPWDKIAKTIN